MSPLRPYPPAGLAPLNPEAQRARAILVHHLRTAAATLTAQQVEHLVSFLAGVEEAEAPGMPGELDGSNALHHGTR